MQNIEIAMTLRKTKPDPAWVDEEMTQHEWNEKLVTWSNIALAFAEHMPDREIFLVAADYKAEEVKGL